MPVARVRRRRICCRPERLDFDFVELVPVDVDAGLFFGLDLPAPADAEAAAAARRVTTMAAMKVEKMDGGQRSQLRLRMRPAK